MRPLTSRQREVLTLLARGFSMQQTALELGVSYSCIKSHCCNAYERLGLKRRRPFIAIVQAVRTGQITLG